MTAFVLMVQVQIKPDAVDDFMAMALENAAATRSTEPGCRQFDVVVNTEDRTRVAYYEVYDSENAFESHLQTAHFKKYLDNAVPLLASRERTFFNRIAP